MLSCEAAARLPDRAGCWGGELKLRDSDWSGLPMRKAGCSVASGGTGGDTEHGTLPPTAAPRLPT